jgi:hypothetical protein
MMTKEGQEGYVKTKNKKKKKGARVKMIWLYIFLHKNGVGRGKRTTTDTTRGQDLALASRFVHKSAHVEVTGKRRR